MSDKIRRAPHNTENPFAQISREMLQDKTLSYEARGLLGYLLSKSGNWETRVSDLQIKGAGRDKVYRIIAELQAKGYISLRRKYQDEKGQWQWTPYDVYETRELNPFTENPYTDKPNTENTEIKVVKKNTKERDTKEEQKETTYVPVGTPLISSPADWDIGMEADDNAMFSVKGKKQISAQAENGTKRLSKPTTTPPPSPTPSAPAPEMVIAPSSLTGADGTAGKAKKERKPNHTALVIDTIWGKGVSGGLLPMLMGHAKRKPHSENNIEGGMTEFEIVAFGRWYRNQNPKMNLPEVPYKVHDSIESFRNALDYDQWMQEGERYHAVYFPKGAAKAAPLPAKMEETMTPDEVEALKRQIIEGGLGDVFGDLFDEYVPQENMRDIS